MARRVAISVGHGQKIRGARGNPVPPQLDEVDAAKRMVDRVAEILGCAKFFDTTSTSVNSNLNAITGWHNQQTRDLDVSFHLNCYDHTAHGVEVLYVTQQSLASQVSAALAATSGWTNRGAKYRTDLAFLNNTNKPAILLEMGFCDNTGDCNKFNDRFEQIAQTIASSITGAEVPVEPPIEEPPVEPPIEENRIDVTSAWSPEASDVRLIVNDTVIREGDSARTITLTIKRQGDVTLVINGEEFHNYPPTEPPTEGPGDPFEVPVESRPMLKKGDTGQDVVDLQDMLNWTADLELALTADGDFGPATESAVYAYQGSRGLGYDGICGQETWKSLYAKAPPLPPPPHALTTQQIKDITAIANNSAIHRYSWRDRGVAPQGYTQGVALAFGQSLKKLNAGHAAVTQMARARNPGNATDVFNVYRSEFASLGMDNDVAGLDCLRNLYAFLLGLGMRESSGKACCGRDQSASNTTADTAEAGLYQTSYNARSFSAPYFTDLQAEYSKTENKPTCYNPSFYEGVSCSAADWENYGSGAGMEFQALCKECPPFAVETAALTVRSRSDHYGPINRHEVELRADSEALFRAVQDYLDGAAVA